MFILLTIILCFILFICFIKFYYNDKIKSIYAKNLDRLKIEKDMLEKNKIDPTKVVSIIEHDRIKNEYEQQYRLLMDNLEEIKVDYDNLKSKNNKLVNQRQVNHIKLGQIAEQLAPLLNKFPYDHKKLTALFQPIDYIYFGDDEIVFIEFKTGNSKMTQKQRNLKKLIDNGKVRMEVHKMTSDEYKIL